MIRAFDAPQRQSRFMPAGGAGNRAISIGISLNICRDTATSAIWKVTQRPRMTILRRS